MQSALHVSGHPPLRRASELAGELDQYRRNQLGAPAGARGTVAVAIHVTPSTDEGRTRTRVAVAWPRERRFAALHRLICVRRCSTALS